MNRTLELSSCPCLVPCQVSVSPPFLHGCPDCLQAQKDRHRAWVDARGARRYLRYARNPQKRLEAHFLSPWGYKTYLWARRVERCLAREGVG